MVTQKVCKKAYSSLGKSKEPYFCPYCSNNSYKKEINELKESVQALTNKLSSLDKQTGPVEFVPSSESASDVASNQPSTNHPSQSNPTVSRISSFPNARKFIVVLSGLAECPKGTKKFNREWSDLNNVRFF